MLKLLFKFFNLLLQRDDQKCLLGVFLGHLGYWSQVGRLLGALDELTLLQEVFKGPFFATKFVLQDLDARLQLSVFRVVGVNRLFHFDLVLVQLFSFLLTSWWQGPGQVGFPSVVGRELLLWEETVGVGALFIGDGAVVGD